jgi:hypothetical protein
MLSFVIFGALFPFFGFKTCFRVVNNRFDQVTLLHMMAVRKRQKWPSLLMKIYQTSWGRAVPSSGKALLASQLMPDWLLSHNVK